MKPTIVMVPRLAKPLVDRMSEHYEVLGPVTPPVPGSLPPGSEKAKVLITLGGNKTNAAMMDALPSLELICCYGTGYEGVDFAEAAKRGIRVTNAADANATAVAEFAMALVLASARQIVPMDGFTKAGQWRGGGAIGHVEIVPGLAGRKLGVYGLGAIGKRVATRAAAFEMEIGYHGRAPRDEPYRYFDTLLGLAEWCDILVVAVRAMDENRHAINAEVLKALGPQGHVVNVSRGIAIDEDALCDALETGTIAGAGLDVYQNEPNVSERIRRAPRTVLAPHAAAFAGSAQATQQQLILDNLAAFFAGKPLVSPVA